MRSSARAEQIVEILEKLLGRPVRTTPFPGGHVLEEDPQEIFALASALEITKTLRDELIEAERAGGE